MKSKNSLVAFMEHCLDSDDVILKFVGAGITGVTLVLFVLTVLFWIVPVGVYQYLKWRKENES